MDISRTIDERAELAVREKMIALHASSAQAMQELEANGKKDREEHEKEGAGYEDTAFAARSLQAHREQISRQMRKAEQRAVLALPASIDPRAWCIDNGFSTSSTWPPDSDSTVASMPEKKSTRCMWKHPTRFLRKCTACSRIKACKECHDWCQSCDKRVCSDCIIECEWCGDEHGHTSTCMNCDALFPAVAVGDADVCLACIMFDNPYEGVGGVGICRKCNLVVSDASDMADHADEDGCDATTEDVDTDSTSKARFLWEKTSDNPRARRLVEHEFARELGLHESTLFILEDMDEGSDGQYSSDTSTTPKDLGVTEL